MILRGGRVAVGAEDAVRMDVGIERGRLRLPARGASGPEMDCEGLLILPGLINAHDHLEFNLFPRLGAGPYRNATVWAHDIYQPQREPLRRHLAVPKPVRLLWGGLKNLVSGVTTVMHHNPYDSTFDAGFPVRVVKRFGWAHSVEFSPDAGYRYGDTAPDTPFVIHAGEGTDDSAAEEIQILEALGALGANTVLVHAVGLSAEGLELVKQRAASLVWCPTSNLFTLGRTLSALELDSGVAVALGTDSALTADGDMTDETAVAAAIAGWPRVYRMVTEDAARVMRLAGGAGELRHGGAADLVLLSDRGQTPAAALAGLLPEAVFVDGELRLLSDERAATGASRWMKRAERLEIEGRGCWRVDCDLAAIREPARRALGPCLLLAGRRLAA